MTPPINSVSTEEIAKAMDCDKWDADTWAVVNAVTENDDHMSTEQAIALGIILAARRAANTPVSDDETYEIGKRDGYEEAVQHIDVRTGGDGEYRYCTDHDPDRHTPDAPAMIERIVARFDALSAPLALPSQVVGELQKLRELIEGVDFVGTGSVARGEQDRQEAFRLLDALASYLTSPAAEPVAWVTADILAALHRGERAVPGWKRSDDFCIPLYAGHPASLCFEGGDGHG